MRSSHRKIVSLLMLVTFVVMSFGAYGFSSKWFAHEVDHARQASNLLASHDHSPPVDAESAPNSVPMSDAEHQLLHACNHAEQYVSPVFNGLVESTVQVAPTKPYLLSLRLPALESPFRPPRTFSFS